jgi:hypothetical protein
MARPSSSAAAREGKRGEGIRPFFEQGAEYKDTAMGGLDAPRTWHMACTAILLRVMRVCT